MTAVERSARAKAAYEHAAIKWDKANERADRAACAYYAARESAQLALAQVREEMGTNAWQLARLEEMGVN